jgi:hypothetical protein
MRQADRFSGVIVRVDNRGAWVTLQGRELLCEGGGNLPVGTRVEFVVASTSQGEIAVIGSQPLNINSGLSGNRERWFKLDEERTPSDYPLGGNPRGRWSI